MSAAGDFRKWREKVIKTEIPNAAKLVIATLHKELVERTPVDTGWARSRWRVGDSLPLSSDAPKGSPVSDPVKITFTADGTAYVYNAVPYIVPLNQGHSEQAQAGFVEATVATVLSAFGE